MIYLKLPKAGELVNHKRVDRLYGVGVQHQFLDYMNGASRDPGWRETTNAMGEAPILDHGAHRIRQSGAILTYLADKHASYGGTTPEERLEVLRWLLFDNHSFTSYRFSKSFGPAAPDLAVMARYPHVGGWAERIAAKW